MPIEVKTIEQIQDEMRAAIQAVLVANHITDADVQLGTLIGAAVGFAKSKHVSAGEFIAAVKTCMTLWGIYAA